MLKLKNWYFNSRQNSTLSWFYENWSRDIHTYRGSICPDKSSLDILVGKSNIIHPSIYVCVICIVTK